MIKNLKSLLKNLPTEERKSRETLLKITEEILTKIDPGNLIDIKKLPKHKNLYVIGTGKGASKMAQAIEKKFTVTEGFITIPEGEIAPKLKRIKYYRASHPLPNETGVRGAKRILKISQKATKDDLVIALISGGGSALMPLPIIPLAEKTRLTNRLLKSGANIQEINTVRKHLSLIKGGHLAEAIKPAKCLCFVISDVLGDDLSSIASGPLAADPTTIQDAQKILKKYRIKQPKTWLETPKKTTNVRTKILANHETVAKEAAHIIRKLGYKPIILDKHLEGECRDQARKLTASCKLQVANYSKAIYIATGETTVTVRGKGAGGRNQEFVLAAIMANPEITVLSIGTDGVDGFCPRKTAGAIASPSTSRKNAEKYLANNDSYHFFQKNGGLIKTGPTGTNLGDLVLIYPFQNR